MCDQLNETPEIEELPTKPQPAYPGETRQTVECTLLLHITLALERKSGKFKFDETNLLYRSLWDNIWAGLNQRLDPWEESLAKALTFNPDTENIENLEAHKTAADLTSLELKSLIRRLGLPSEEKEVLIKSIAVPPSTTKTEEVFLYGVYCLYEAIRDVETRYQEDDPIFIASLANNLQELIKLRNVFMSIRVLYDPYEAKVRALLAPK
jgi:hypothetical protein